MENVIEFLQNSETASVTLSQKRYIRKLVKRPPDQAQILAENPDGTIFARIPVSWVKI